MTFSDTLESVILLTEDACTQTYRHTDRHTDSQTYRHTHRHTDTQTDTQTHRHTVMTFNDTLESVILLTEDACTQTHRHTDRQTQTHRHTQS